MENLDNGLIFIIRDFINGKPKVNYSYVVNDINKLAKVCSVSENKLEFIKDQTNYQNYILNNFQIIYESVFHGDIPYKKALNIASKKIKYCPVCKKQIFLKPEILRKSITNDNILFVIEHWYLHNFNKECC